MRRFRKGVDMDAKRLQAQRLVLKDHKTQKEAAIIVGVSERTMSLWAKRFNWQKQMKNQNALDFDDSSLFGDFINDVKLNEPETYKIIQQSLDSYLKRLQKEFVF